MHISSMSTSCRVDCVQSLPLESVFKCSIINASPCCKFFFFFSIHGLSSDGSINIQ